VILTVAWQSRCGTDFGRDGYLGVVMLVGERARKRADSVGLVRGSAGVFSLNGSSKGLPIEATEDLVAALSGAQA
jgi:hypothetical protein